MITFKTEIDTQSQRKKNVQICNTYAKQHKHTKIQQIILTILVNILVGKEICQMARVVEIQ